MNNLSWAAPFLWRMRWRSWKLRGEQYKATIGQIPGNNSAYGYFIKHLMDLKLIDSLQSWLRSSWNAMLMERTKCVSASMCSATTLHPFQLAFTMAQRLWLCNSFKPESAVKSYFIFINWLTVLQLVSRFPQPHLKQEIVFLAEVSVPCGSPGPAIYSVCC